MFEDVASSDWPNREVNLIVADYLNMLVLKPHSEASAVIAEREAGE